MYFFVCYKDIDGAYNRGLEEGRATVKTVSQVSYEKGFNEGKASVNAGEESSNGGDAESKEQMAGEVLYLVCEL